MPEAIRDLSKYTFLVVGALFPIVNPIGDTPIFLALTRGLSDHGRAVLARMIALEVGKPLAQAGREVGGCVEQFEWYAEEAKRIYGEILPSRTPDGKIVVEYQPVGIVATYSAWNFPAVLLARKLAPALAAGCSAICRPADETPGTAMLLVQCCHDAGVPAGVVNLLTGKPADISPTLMASPEVRKISLTGSTRVGREVLAAAAQTVKRVSMELGGHSPVIVDDTVDIDQVVDTIVPEPTGGAHRDPAAAIAAVGEAIANALAGLRGLDRATILRLRREKFFAIGRTLG